MIRSIDLAALSPVQKMELADALYDAALEEMEAARSLPDEQPRANPSRTTLASNVP